MIKAFRVIYEDQDILVCYKPAGVPVQTKNLRMMDLMSMIKNDLVKKSHTNNPYLAVINRLDQPVEGIVLFARNKVAAAKLSAQLQNDELGKFYLAVVEGVMQNNTGVLQDYLLKDGKTNTSVVTTQEAGGKKSILEYKVLESSQECELLEIHLRTGRHHQIRVQLSHAGHAICGDMKYNSMQSGKNSTIALCAYCLQLTHPSTRKQMEFKVKPQGKKFADFTYCEALTETI